MRALTGWRKIDERNRELRGLTPGDEGGSAPGMYPDGSQCFEPFSVFTTVMWCPSMSADNMAGIALMRVKK